MTKACLTLFDPLDCSTPGFPVPHHLPEFGQIHIHWISDAIQPSHPLLPSSHSVFSLSPSIRVFFKESATSLHSIFSSSYVSWFLFTENSSKTFVNTCGLHLISPLFLLDPLLPYHSTTIPLVKVTDSPLANLMVASQSSSRWLCELHWTWWFPRPLGSISGAFLPTAMAAPPQSPLLHLSNFSHSPRAPSSDLFSSPAAPTPFMISSSLMTLNTSCKLITPKLIFPT